MLSAFLLLAELTGGTLGGGDVLEPSVLNEVEHAVARGESAWTSSVPATASERLAVAGLVRGREASDAAILLVSRQDARGLWFVGPTNVTAAALEALRGLGGLPPPAAPAPSAEPGVVCEGGVCRLVAAPAESVAPERASAPPPRVAYGFLSPGEFCAFLAGDAPTAGSSTARLSLLLFLLTFLGGIALNLTPCVLPLVPVNLIVIGASARRGLVYGLGMALAYGVLGLLAALGGTVFGLLQGSPWFNAALALLFVALGLSLCGVWHLDFSRFRRRAGVFAMGALTAVLAGACVAPVLVSTLLVTANLYGGGNRLALALPFALGLGMAAPWPFLGAGLRILPKPGAWTKWVNRAFAVLVFALAVRYGWQALRPAAASATDATPETIGRTLSEWRARPHAKPLLVECSASWCGSCAAMARTTLRDARVLRALEAYEVVHLAAEDLGALRKQPDFSFVRGLPCFAVFGRDRVRPSPARCPSPVPAGF